MRKIIIILFLYAFAISASAQEKNTYTVGFDTQASLYGNSGLKTIELGVDLGYNVTNWLSAWLRFEESIGLFDIDNIKSYQTSSVLGGVVGLNIVRSRVGVLTVKASGGGTVGGNDWKYSYYSGGAYFNFTLNKMKPILGFGIRYYDSKSAVFGNHFRLYCSLGFRFN